MKGDPILASFIGNARNLYLCALLLVAAAGCGSRHHSNSSGWRSSVSRTPNVVWPDEQKMLFEYAVREEEAALEAEHVVLVFCGLTPRQQRLFHFQGQPQAVQIAGPGQSSVTTTCANGKDTLTFRSEYADGTNTLHFGKECVRFTQSGRLLLVGDQAVDVSEGRKIIHLRNGKFVVK